MEDSSKIKKLQAIIEEQAECLNLLTEAVNDWAYAVGVKGFRIDTDHNHRFWRDPAKGNYEICFLDCPDDYSGPLYGATASRAVFGLLDVIADKRGV